MTSPLPIRAFQWDLARQVERLDFLLRWLPRYADWGYQELHLHLEDAVEYPSLPGVARADAYSYAQFAHLVAAATAVGIKVVPIINLLGHTQYLIKVAQLRTLNELRDTRGRPLARGQICPLHPRTLEIAEKLLRDMAPFCTAGKVHVGLDESFHLGRCPRCRADIERRGLAAHFGGYAASLHGLCQELGLRMGLWADMLALLPAAIPGLPREIIAYDWYYYPFPRHPRVELRNFADIDLATPLRARGIEYWGCPMSGAFRYEPMPIFGERLANIVSWWRRCQRVGAGGFLVTSWEPNRLAIETAIAVDAAAACLWLNPEIDDATEMLARGFARVFGTTRIEHCRAASPNAAIIESERKQGGVRRPRPTTPDDWRQLSRAALAADGHAFAGYYRWQINDRWDVCAGRDGAAPYEDELRALEDLRTSALACDEDGTSVQRRRSKARSASAPCSLLLAPAPQSSERRLPPGCSPALAASFAFRRYLAQRDVFVRRAAQGVFELRQLNAALVGRGSPPPRGDIVGHKARPTFEDALAQLRAEAAIFTQAIRAGRAAARTMWKRSRDPSVPGPNARMMDRDAARLREWRLWLRRAESHPEIIWQATPVCGAWQLQFTVHNFAPALQKIVVEQQQPDGTWTTLHGLPLIEFRAFAARRRAGIRREFSVPMSLPDNMVGRVIPNAPRRVGDNPPYLPAEGRLRIAVRGVGQVAISNVDLTNGVMHLRPRGWPRTTKRILGQPAPQRGFPHFDFDRNVGELSLAALIQAEVRPQAGFHRRTKRRRAR